MRTYTPEMEAIRRCVISLIDYPIKRDRDFP